MGRCWGVLFLISLAAAVPLGPPKTFQEALSQVVKIYNQGPNIQNAFRLLQATPLPGLNSSSVTLQQLNFTIQETVCPASEKRDPEQCEFKPDGLVKDCSGYFSTEQANSLIVITCDAVVQEPVRITRFRALRGFLRGFRRGINLWGSNE
ncbi:cathelicidin-3-like [Elgaria multicarinata webbii]|uniref:cathelicidin-3-like n=1 Tax=Elgaria multicarinata webbii TaxID=159646 RepID=UPI002FCCBDF5